MVRPFNTYGPRQSARAIIPAVSSQLAAGAEILHIADTRPARTSTTSRTLAVGLISLSGRDAAVGDAVDMGSGVEASIADAVALIQSLMGTQALVKTDQ
jgi:dTDP-glucose 4,6-dehydratase